MGGLISNFIAGAAGEGARLYGQQTLEDQRLQNEIMKAQRISELTMAQNERQRAQTAERVKSYGAPVESSVNMPGAATEFDDDGNPNNVNSFTKNTSRDPTLDEMAMRAGKSGNLQEMGMISTIANKDARVEALLERDRARERMNDKTNETRKGIADDKNDLTRELKFDADGNPIVKGAGSGPHMIAVNSIRDDIKGNDKRVDAAQKQLDALADNLTMSDSDKQKKMESLTKRVDDLIIANKTLRNKRDELNNNFLTPRTGSLGTPPAGDGLPPADAIVPSPSAKIVSPLDALDMFKKRGG